jgi:hypothetical protein
MALPIAAGAASVVRVEWSKAQAIKSLEVRPEWRALLEDFCARLEIPGQEPRWWLTATAG